MLSSLKYSLIKLEQRKFLIGELTISSLSHTQQENKRHWGNCNWLKGGEEWTPSPEWKRSIIDRLILKYSIPGSAILEIGPGAGRWTTTLQSMASRLVLVDIAEECLSLCKKKFFACHNVEYYLFQGDGLGFMSDSCIDFVWSYDVFVHLNPTHIESYLRDIRRVLKPGGYAVIHHSGGNYPSDREACEGWRSHMTGRFFAHLAIASGMNMVEQLDSFAHKRGDIISVFSMPE